MAKEFYTILTAAGKEKLLRATVSNKLEIKTFAVGDGQGRYYEPNEDQVALVNQKYKANVNAVSLERNQITIECLVPSSVGGFTIRELGVYDKDDTLLLIAKYPATEKPISGSGSEKDLHIKVILELDNAENVAITADANVVVATMGNVKNELKKYYNKQEVDEKIEGFTSVEVINNLESTETNAALSAAQGKELKRLIDEVPQIEIVDNMTTNNSQKALSAAQGVAIAERLKKTGLKVVEGTYRDNKIAIEGIVQPDNIPFLLNLNSVYRNYLNFDDYTKIEFHTEGQTRSFSLTRFNEESYLQESPEGPTSLSAIEQRQFLCVKVGNKVWIDVYPAILGKKLWNLERLAEQAFQSAHEGKRKLADALVSKGQVISNTASFQEMAQKIREISNVPKSIKLISPKNISLSGSSPAIFEIPNIPAGTHTIEMVICIVTSAWASYGWSGNISLYETRNNASTASNPVYSPGLSVYEGKAKSYISGTVTFDRPIRYARVEIKLNGSNVNLDRATVGRLDTLNDTYEGYTSRDHLIPLVTLK